MARLPKTLVLTHFPWGSKNGTIRHLEPLFERYPDDLVWYSMKDPWPPGPSEPPGVPYGHGGYALKPGRAPRVLRWLNYGPAAWRAAFRAARYGRKHGANLVVAVMSGEAVVAATATARALGVPLALWVSDDPPSAFANSKLPRGIQHLVARRFSSAMRKARSFGVISTDLAALYKERYGVDALVLYKGVDPRTCVIPPASAPGGDVVIGSVGTVNSDANWQTLLDAVRSLNAKGGRRYRILHVGDLPEHLRAPEVEATGWIAPSQINSQLVRFDLCFLTLWFEDTMRTSALTAFPTKITSYIQSQRPIISFCIPDSRIVKLVREFGCGVACTQPDAAALASALERAVEPDGYRAAVTGMSRLRDAYSMDAYFRNFETFLQRAQS